MEEGAIENFMERFDKAELEEVFLNLENQFLKEINSLTSQDKIDLLNTVFREMHSLKGSAGVLKIESLVKFLHLQEDVLNLIMQNASQINKVKNNKVFNVFLNGLDIVEGICLMLKNDASFLPKNDLSLSHKYFQNISECRNVIKNLNSYFEIGSLDTSMF